MADQTQEAMREEFEQWYVENAFDYPNNPIGSRDCGLQRKAWQAATAQSAEKIARLEAEKQQIQKLCELEANEKARYKSLLKTSSTEAEVLLRGEVAGLLAKLAAAELSNRQLRDMLKKAEPFIGYGQHVPQLNKEVAEALAQKPSTEALDAYVAKLNKWQPIETPPDSDRNVLTMWRDRSVGTNNYYEGTGWAYGNERIRLWAEIPPLPPTPDKE